MNTRVIILSHKGRPKEFDPVLSLAPYAEYISAKIDEKVIFAPDTRKLPEGRVLLLENLRFDPREEQNDPSFAAELAKLGTMYVNDAFAVSHRANTSVSAITKFLPSYAGLLFEKEYSALSKVMDQPDRPLVFVIGGAKIADKLGVIEKFWDKADLFLLGGGPANTVLKAKGVDIQNSIYDENLIDFASRLAASDKVIAPQDWEVGDHRILDIGSSSVRKFSEYISSAKTVVWNGPMGLYEDPRFKAGSLGIARAIVASTAYSIVGGGETTELIASIGLEDKFSFVSTAGGAMLEFLAGKDLPGVAALSK
jgi:3-phosphoglycerate kinase